MNTLFTHIHQRIIPCILICVLIGAPLYAQADTGTSTPPTDQTSAATEAAPSIEVENLDEDETKSISTSTPENATPSATSSTETVTSTTSATTSLYRATTTQATTTESDVTTDSSTSTDTIIDTGHALAETETDNTINSTEVTTVSTSSSTTIIDAVSDVDVHNTGTTTADTGDNHATTTKTAIINTGDVVASHSFINLVNTTVLNSNGFVWLLNLLFGTEDLDMRSTDLSSFFTEHSPEPAVSNSTSVHCSLTGCDDSNVSYTVSNTNTATVTNSHILRANTGANTAHGAQASIDTGNAYAFLNGINLVNSTFVDSNYLLVAMNQTGNYAGDVILPGSAFFKKFLTSPSATNKATTAIAVHNDAIIENTFDVHAGTGDNLASTSNDASILTGESCAYADVTNTVNQTLIGGHMVDILVRVSGDWSGEIFGLPDGLLWERTDAGIRIYTETEPNLSFESPNSTPAQASTTIRNSTYISNDISVSALTGDNTVHAEDGTIRTGDACAVATVQNMANTTVVGSNWMSAFFNILGNFSGNISFGQPDLWIGGVADLTEDHIRPGGTLLYTYTIFNNGDATASDVVLTQDGGAYLRDIRTNDIERVSSTTPEQWHIGVLGPGDSTEVTFSATVVDALPYGMTPINLLASVTGHEPDANTLDNHETVGLLAYRQAPYSGGGGGSRASSQSSKPPALHIEKWAGTSTDQVTITTPTTEQSTSSPVRYTIVVTNAGGPAYDATLHDVLGAADNTIINEQLWDLGTIAAGETIEISYTVHLDDSVADGIYTNAARLEAYSNEQQTSRNNEANMINKDSSAQIIVARTPLTIRNVEVDATGSHTDTYTAKIRWETNVPSDSRVVYGPVGSWDDMSINTDRFGYAEMASVSTSTTDHIVLLGSLRPNVTYEFRALSYQNDTYAISDEGIFVTPPATLATIALPQLTESHATVGLPVIAFAPPPIETPGVVAGTSTTNMNPGFRNLFASVANAQSSANETPSHHSYDMFILALLASLYIAWVAWRRHHFRIHRRYR